MKLSVIIPAHNEEENIVSVIEKIESLLDLDYELVVVNDHSVDGTAALVKGLLGRYPNIRLVENQADKGFANAVKCGFANAKGELVIPVMGDLCDDLLTLKSMVKKIDQGYDIVCGSRYMEGGGRIGGSKLKSFLSSLGGRSLFHILNIPTHDIANAFKMYRRKVIEAIDVEARGFEISMEIPLKAYYLGFRIAEVPTVWRERTKGKSSFKIFKLLPSYLRLYLWGVYKSLTKRRQSK